MSEALHVFHPLEPVYDKNSKILILGTIPSPKSREVGFYYSHPQNRFWRVLAKVLDSAIPSTISEKKVFLQENRIALWDVLQSCHIKNADDNSIFDPVANDISHILLASNVSAVFTTGRKATALYNKYCVKDTTPAPIYLPSTSPANCGIGFDALTDAYHIILDYL